MPSSTTHCKRTSPVARVALVLALLQVVSGALRPTLRTRVLGLRMGLPEVPIASTHSGIDLERDVYLHPDEKPYSDGSRPAGAPELAQSNFKRQFGALAQGAWETLVGREVTNTTMPECLGLTLSNAAVTNAERRREAANGGVDAHPVSRVLYNVGCFFLDNFFDGRPIQRFWFLETVARIPYFSCALGAPQGSRAPRAPQRAWRPQRGGLRGPTRLSRPPARARARRPPQLHVDAPPVRVVWLVARARAAQGAQRAGVERGSARSPRACGRVRASRARGAPSARPLPTPPARAPACCSCTTS